MNCTKEQLLEKIKEAYDKTGLIPHFGEYFSDDNACACPVSVLHCAATKSRSFWFSPSVARNTFAKMFDVDQEWINDFIHAIDGTGNYSGHRSTNEGFQYGQYIRKELETRSVESLVGSAGSNEKLPS